jgi:uracil DNA glycosylase
MLRPYEQTQHSRGLVFAAPNQVRAPTACFLARARSSAVR